MLTCPEIFLVVNSPWGSRLLTQNFFCLFQILWRYGLIVFFTEWDTLVVKGLLQVTNEFVGQLCGLQTCQLH